MHEKEQAKTELGEKRHRLCFPLGKRVEVLGGFAGGEFLAGFAGSGFAGGEVVAMDNLKPLTELLE